MTSVDIMSDPPTAASPTQVSPGTWPCSVAVRGYFRTHRTDIHANPGLKWMVPENGVLVFVRTLP